MKVAFQLQSGSSRAEDSCLSVCKIQVLDQSSRCFPCGLF
jgi:hypothetical protein